MNARPTIIALVIAILLAGVAWFVLGPPGHPTSSPGGGTVAVGERLMRLHPATLTRIRVSTDGDRGQVVEREGGTWWWRAAEDRTDRFAMDESRMRALFMLLDETRAVAQPAAGTGASLARTPPPVTVTFEGNEGISTLRLSPRGLGGQVLVEVTPHEGNPRLAVINDTLLSVLTSPGPSAWRETRALMVEPGEASVITFTDSSGTKGFGLSRRGNSWLLTSPAPVTCPASVEGVSAVVRAIGAITISRFFDDPASRPTVETAGLDTPSAVLTMEFDDRSINPEDGRVAVKPRVVKLLVGQPANTQGNMLYGSVDGGTTIVALDAEPLAKLTTPATELASKVCSTVLAADVGGIRIEGIDTAETGSRWALLERDSLKGTWSERTSDSPDGTVVTQDTAKGAATASIVRMLTMAAADEVSFSPPSDAIPAGRISLRSVSQSDLAVFEVLQLRSGVLIVVSSGVAGTTTNTTQGRVYRAFNSPPDELRRWLAVLAR